MGKGFRRLVSCLALFMCETTRVRKQGRLDRMDSFNQRVVPDPVLIGRKKKKWGHNNKHTSYQVISNNK